MYEHGPPIVYTYGEDIAWSSDIGCSYDTVLEIIYGLETKQRHLKNTHLIGWSKPVLFCSQETILSISVAFEIHHYIYDMLEIFGSCDLTTFGHMSDQEAGHSVGFASF